VPLEIESQIALSGSQTWNISDASANITNPVPVLPLPATQNHYDRYTAFDANQDEDLYFTTFTAGTRFDLGGFTLSLTNSGTTVIDQGFTVANGVINVNQGTLVIQGGKSRQTTVSNNVSINVASGATLRLQTTSGAIVSSAAISLADGSLLNLTAAGAQGTGAVSNSIAVSGNATLSQTQNPIVGGNNNITNIVAANITGASGATLNLLPTQSGTATAVLQLSGDNSGFNGAFNINAVSGIRPVRLSSTTAGSANATWTVNAGNILQVAGVTVGLGTLNGAGTISNSTAATTSTLNVGAGNFSGIIANAGTAVLSLNKITPSTLTLSGADTYTGSTAISNGTLVVNGSIASPVTVYSGGTLGGIGALHSNLLANAGSTLAPGNPGSIGTLTVSGTITNGGAILMKLNRTNSQTSDQLDSAKTITITGAGTLTVTNLGPTLQAGDTFQLFNQAVTGFAATSLPVMDANNSLLYTWTNKVGINGSIQLLTALPSVNTTPTNITFQASGGNLTVSWPSDHTGWTLLAQTNSLQVGLSTNWVAVTGSSITNQMSIPIGPTNGSVFFRLSYP
jgi:autotransporter-associated beta strand protein